MTSTARLSFSDAGGRRVVEIHKPDFLIGRRTSADLQVVSRDVSREHARIAREGDGYLVSDCGSRFGTFVNDEPVVQPRLLAHGDRIRLGQSDAVDLVFLTDDDTSSGLREAVPDLAGLRQMTFLLNGLRALGAGRVLDEVLTLVLDGALEVTSAERGFVMLAAPAGGLELKIGRAKGRVALSGSSFAISQKIPRAAFETGQTQIVDPMAGEHEHTVAAGIGLVFCVPLKVSPPATAPSERVQERIIGVLYLDARRRVTVHSVDATKASLEVFATQAALAIESARLYADAAERAKLEREWRVAAEIQRALLPEPRWRGKTSDLAAASVPCRTIGGDFFDYLDLSGGLFGFALGDVAGKGPPAALLAATVQSNFVAHAPVAADPADLMARLNGALLRRAIEARFATMFYGAISADGRLQYSNAGQEPPLVVRSNGAVDHLDVGGPVLGLLPAATYDFGIASLDPGDVVIMCSDGVTEAQNAAGEEFGRDRVTEVLREWHGREPEAVLEQLLSALRGFAGAAPQTDDITALVFRYRGP